MLTGTLSTSIYNSRNLNEVLNLNFFGQVPAIYNSRNLNEVLNTLASEKADASTIVEI